MNGQELYEEARAKRNIPKETERDFCQPGYYYAYARNMLLPADYCEGDEERMQRISSGIENFMLRTYVALKIGGALELRQPQENAPWYVILHHKDGTTEPVESFRRRKRAEAWIANMYLYVFQPLTGW